MVKIQIQSDLHLEVTKSYDIFEIVPKAPYLALLGDIGCISKHYNEYAQFLLTQLRNFKAVLLVLGNHEPYHSSWVEAKASMVRFRDEDVAAARQQEGGEQLGAFVLLDQTRFDIDDDEEGGVTILGCTLFSKDWEVEEHNQEHARDLAWLNSEVESLSGGRRRVAVLTHYCPTFDERAQDPQHKDSPIRSGFATELSGEPCWKSESVKLWAFGHTHYNCNFVDEYGKRIYANQRGYVFSQSPGFDGTAVVEV
ncbi:hypothetical protein PG999_014635 [Apiospora kogelbergensis]|uniref:Calcineurin-like phosphoesterase domain-containing protein n=1 Tax=Apiospora kogelbergensis TaxID=1337665 RepID=A0AAW0QDW6_9PEZI